ncbi:MAG: hypothetical protein K1X55_14335 [Chitinophagales bacterium]|nr:hypothetical protein [Chitinophagales bacterium]
MNIIIQQEEHVFLQGLVIKKYRMGSHLYGLARPDSDIDYLCIYRTSEVEKASGLPNGHQFQYKESSPSIDWIYCSELQFWKNLFSGDATINADIVLFSGDWQNSLEICRTYKVIKAYLGFGKRDLKQIKEGTHKLYHAARSLYCAEQLLQNQLPTIQGIQDLHGSKQDVQDLIEKEQALRAELNRQYDAQALKTYYVDSCDHPLWQKLLDSNNIKEFKYG